MLRRRHVYRITFYLAALALIILMFAAFEHSQVYHPSREFMASGRELGRPFQEIHFTAADKTPLHAWFFPADPSGNPTNLLFLICHGNGGNISHRLDLVDAILDTGAAVFLFDYRGYGRSQGRPSEQGTYLDAQAAYAWVRQHGFAPHQIIALGESLGGGVATELAIRESLGGLLLLATFTSIPDIGAEIFPWLPVRLLSRIKYDTLSKLPKLKIPVVIMHSRDDTLVRFKHSERNLAALDCPKALIELRGGHNEATLDDAAFRRGLDKIIALTLQHTPQPR